MPENEWSLYTRKSKIDINGNIIDHPIEANIWQLPIKSQVEYLKSIAIAGCNTGEEMPWEFVPWIYWKLGQKVANDYMIPYNQKMFGENLDALGTYWLEKLPNVSFDETLLSCLTRKAYGTQPGHSQFYYPNRYGYGELWSRMAMEIQNHILYHTKIVEIDFDNLAAKDDDNNIYYAKNIITTVPWTGFRKITGLPVNLTDDIYRELKHTSIQIAYYSRNMDTDAHWIYYPDMHLAYHRILIRRNFCPDSNGYWTETNLDRVDLSNDTAGFSYINKYAYPLNTLKKPQIMRQLLAYARKKHVYGLGRWGEHQHYNSDVTVKKAIDLFHKICTG